MQNNPISFRPKNDDHIEVSFGKTRLDLDNLKVESNWIGQRYVTDQTGKYFGKINDLIVGLERNQNTLTSTQSKQILARINTLISDKESQGYGIHMILSNVGNWIFGRTERLDKLTSVADALSEIENATNKLNSANSAVERTIQSSEKAKSIFESYKAQNIDVGVLESPLFAARTAINEAKKALEKINKNDSKEFRTTLEQIGEQLKLANKHSELAIKQAIIGEEVIAGIVNRHKELSQAVEASQNALKKADAMAREVEESAKKAIKELNPENGKTAKKSNQLLTEADIYEIQEKDKENKNLKKANLLLSEIRMLQNIYPDSTEIGESVKRAEKAIKKAYDSFH